MEAVIGLFVLMLGVSHSVETYCDGRQDGAQCYGPLGGTVVLQLMNNASEIHKFQWLNKNTVILEGRMNNISSNLIENRSSFTPSDGTFRINKLSRTDGGEYRLRTFDSNGTQSENRTLQLTIQAPVSSVLLVSGCLSQGEMKVSCSSEGAESPQYSWTLDAHALTDSELLSVNTETNSITLKQHVSGTLVCSVKNNVSSNSTEVKISTCGVETYCDGRQNRAQCYGALGGTVVLQLMTKASEIHKYQWLDSKTTVILEGRRNNIVSNLIENRSSFTPSDGTFRINKLSRTDGGEYRLRTFDSDGTQLENRALQLTIQAPVSSVLLVSECLSQREMKVSCSSEGAESPQYSWTLDDHALTDSELLSGNTKTNSITLKQHVSGTLVCSVKNKVSSVSTEVKISTCGVETYCDGRQNRAQCYGALGGTVVLQLMTKASEIHIYQWLDSKTTVILEGRRNNIVSNLIENRSSFTPSDGTFRINKLSRTDGGEYRLRTFDSDGTQLENRALQLTIQAPVSSVLLVSECLSQGEMKVSCSSEGAESPQYSWTLDDHALTYSELLSGNTKTNSITLKQHVSGTLVCSVKNKVSSVSTEVKISTCGVETYCDGRRNGAQCYGPLGGTVVLQLMNKASATHRYQWLSKTASILNVRRNIVLSNRLENRSSFTPSNGTFRINKLSRTDGGEYRLISFDSDGTHLENRALQLTIQAPVSSVLLVYECLSQGEMKVSCSSEGAESPQYSWTLDAHALTHSELLSVNTETNSITLKQHVSGTLVCSVKNNVSSISTEVKISTCGE
ncbi:immunoglobulin superfamily member 10-like [Lycodopsis pacificus]